MKTLLAAASALILSAGLASAATTNSTAGGQTQANAATSSNQTQANAATAASGPAAKMRQQLEESLAKAGFTDIKIMPESFLIRAKDQNGNPMMMVVNPDSVTEVEAVTPNKPNSNNANAATNNANGSTAKPSTAKQ